VYCGELALPLWGKLRASSKPSKHAGNEPGIELVGLAGLAFDSVNRWWGGFFAGRTGEDGVRWKLEAAHTRTALG